ncbi:MAG: DUF1624 domain-containing protein [Oscillospiraceae bacterium]|nr:DUF1624 domain-containing protein [Oscillospiraceae bacterium]
MSKRIQLFDALRGLSILLMLVHHAAIDLVGLHVLPNRLVFNPVVSTLQFVFASVFILLCGFSSEFSRHNFRRAGLLLVCAYALSLVTSFVPSAYIRFGILHCLGYSILIYALIGKRISRVSAKTWCLLFLLGYAVYVLVNAGYWENPDHLWMLGIVPPGFASADYFSLMPWFFLFMLGCKLGCAAKEGKLPNWVYSFRSKFFAAVGRHTLVIYLVHQPIFYGVFYLLGLYNPS